MSRFGILTGLWVAVAVLVLPEVGHGGEVVPRGDVQVAQGQRGMVVSDAVSASQVGRGVLAAGGNAVDAAVAVALALVVAWPEAGNVGGGGFMMVAAPGVEPVCIDYRETAPAAATRDMYDADSSRWDIRAVGVPGTVRGLQRAHAAYGRLPWKDLVMPAVTLAEEGIQVDVHLARSLNGVLDQPQVREDDRFVELRRVFGKPDGSAWRVGDRLVQPDLARTLRTLAEEGPESFYTGTLARQLAAYMETHGGLITLADLAAYDAPAREAIHVRYNGYDVYGPPPPSSGGIAVAIALNTLSHFDLSESPAGSARNMHLIAEAMRRAFADRAAHLGDPDFVAIPGDLTSVAYGARLAATIDPDRATPSVELGPPIHELGERPDTTHFSIIDSDGFVVSNTYTLEASWGARLVVPGSGYLLNNEMGDFNWFPGRTTVDGGIGTEPNTIEPGKRMLSSQCPLIVLKDGQPFLLTGSPGGRTIINTVLGVVLNVIAFDFSLAEAVDAPRLHHQWFPDQLEFEGAADPAHAESVAALRAMGHEVRARPQPQGSAHSILVGRDGDRWRYVGVADWRRGGAAEGY